MAEFDNRKVFSIDEGLGNKLNVYVMFDEAKRAPINVCLSDSEHGSMISVDFDLWVRIVSVVERNKDY